MCFSGAAHDFDKLWNRTYDHEAKLCAFDLIELDGEDYRLRQLVERKRQLFKLLRRAFGGIRIRLPLGRRRRGGFRICCKIGLEGIVSKRIDLGYKPGPSKSWIKAKNQNHPAMMRVKAFELEAVA
jgi:bifunctional non-homologous end joining protein LigD